MIILHDDAWCNFCHSSGTPHQQKLPQAQADDAAQLFEELRSSDFRCMETAPYSYETPCRFCCNVYQLVISSDSLRGLAWPRTRSPATRRCHLHSAHRLGDLRKVYVKDNKEKYSASCAKCLQQIAWNATWISWRSMCMTSHHLLVSCRRICESQL